jgi:hypothetical protein
MMRRSMHRLCNGLHKDLPVTSAIHHRAQNYLALSTLACARSSPVLYGFVLLWGPRRRQAYAEGLHSMQRGESCRA